MILINVLHQGHGTNAVKSHLGHSDERKRLIASLVALVLIGSVGFGVWVLLLRLIGVQVARSERDVAVQVFGLGTVEARVQSKIGFKVSGVLVDLEADVGDRVAKGAVLARLDDREQRAQVARAKAAAEQAEANLQRSAASVEKTKANYANAKNINERRQKLIQSNVASVEETETAKTAQDAALADLNLANSDVLVAQAAISDAKAQMQLQGVTLDFHTLTAPYDAMVTARLKELGSPLAASESVFTIIDPKTVWVLAYIDESKVGEIKVGDPSEIVLRSHPNLAFFWIAPFYGFFHTPWFLAQTVVLPCDGRPLAQAIIVVIGMVIAASAGRQTAT